MSKLAPDQPCGRSSVCSGGVSGYMRVQWCPLITVISCLLKGVFSPKLKSHPDKTLSVLHNHCVDSRRRCQRLSSPPYHNHHCITFAILGEEVGKAWFTDRTETWSEVKYKMFIFKWYCVFKLWSLVKLIWCRKYLHSLYNPWGVVSWKVLPVSPVWVSHQETPQRSHSFLCWSS